MTELKKSIMRRPRRPAEETREDILATAETLFRERGVSGCSIAEIAHAMKMSPANIFKHFHSKAALTDAICERHIGRMIGRLDTMDTAAPAPEQLSVAVSKLMEAHLGDIRENPYLFEMILLMSETDLPSGRHYKALLEKRFAEIIRQGIESGAYKKADPEKVSACVLSAFASILHPVFLAHTDQRELDERRESLIQLVNAALQS